MERWSAVAADTTDDAHRAQAEAYRCMGGRGRSAVMFRLTAMARQNARLGIRSRHPDYDEEMVRRAFCRLLWGDDTAREVWPARELVDP